jgi:hypothetical protein
MTARRLQRVERLQLGAAGVVGLSLLLPWYATDAANPHASIDGSRGDVIGWAAHPVLRWLFLAAVGAAVLSAWQTFAGQAPTHGVPRGETSAVVALTGVALLLFQAWIERPGYPVAEIDLAYGWFLALAGALVALGAAMARLPDAKPTPPGV